MHKCCKYEELVSVIMAVYNTEESFLRAAIESILDQTYENLEFIIVNDGSDAKTTQVLQSYRDKRIVIINNIENQGLTKSLNIALKYAHGKYIARMDADDISYKERIEQQYHFMEKNKTVSAVGCWTVTDGVVSKYLGKISRDYRKVLMLFINAGICHPSAFIRKTFLQEYSIKYDEQIIKAQDYKLWIDIISSGTIEVLPKKLLYYRKHTGQISIADNKDQKNYDMIIRKSLLKNLCPELTEIEERQFLEYKKIILNVREFDNLLYKIEQSNEKLQLYHPQYLMNEFINLWRRWCKLYIKEYGWTKEILKSGYTWKIFTPSYICCKWKVDFLKKL